MTTRAATSKAPQNKRKLETSASVRAEKGVVLPDIPPISAFLSRKAWEEVAWDILIKHIATQSHPAKISQLLSIALAAGERKNMILRAATVVRIRNGKSYREIGNELWVAPQMISTIKKSLREHSYRSYHERSKTERVRRTYSSGPPRRERRPRRRTKYGTIEM